MKRTGRMLSYQEEVKPFRLDQSKICQMIFNTTSSIKTKFCSKCDDLKDIDLFYKNVNTKDGHDSMCKDCRKKNRRQWRKLNQKKYKFTNKVSDTVRKALKQGVIIKPCKCEVCGKKRKLSAHHEDYTKLLIVIWACKPCHNDLDNKRRRKEK